MKLRTKINLLSVIPLLVVTLISLFFALIQFQSSILERTFKGMDATAVSIRNIFQYGAEGEYRLDENGDMWKGKSMNISSSTHIVDDVKEQTGFDVTIFYGDTRELTTLTNADGERQIGTTADKKVSETVLKNGKSFSDADVNVLGSRYIAYYVPIYQDGTETPVGMVFLGQKFSVLFNEVIKIVLSVVAIALILMIVVIIVALLIGRRMEASISKGCAYLDLLEQGHLGFAIEKKLLSRKDVIGNMCRSVASLNHTLTDIIREIQDQCTVLDHNSNICHTTADDLKDSMNQISAVVEEVAATTTSQAEDTENVNGNIAAMGELIGTISDDSHATMNAIEKLDRGMKLVDGAVLSISAQTKQTNLSVGKINAAVELISSIALQTRLLSLNASIEAARAGTAGRGFAVVAEEIQQLAQSSEESSQEIHDILEELEDNSKKSMSVTTEVGQTVESLRKELSDTEHVFTGLMHKIVGNPNAASGEGNPGTTSLNEERASTVSSVNGLAAATQQIAASMEQTSASVTEVALTAQKMGDQALDIKNISDRLKEQMEHFVIDES